MALLHADGKPQITHGLLHPQETAAVVAVEQVSCATSGRDHGWRLVMSKRSGPEAAVAVAVRGCCSDQAFTSCMRVGL